MEKFVHIAGRTIRLISNELPLRLGGLLAAFAIDTPDSWDREVCFSPVETLPAPTGICLYREPALLVYQKGEEETRYIGSVEPNAQEGYLRLSRREEKIFAQVKRDSAGSAIGTKLILEAMETEHFLVKDGGLILHASCVEHQGEAIVFTAPSGTGKSTQAELWKNCRSARIINGDRIALRIGDRGVEARGIPFAGSSNIAEPVCLPLRAIVCLAQAPQTTIDRLSGAKAFRLLWEGVSVNIWNRDDVAQCSQTVARVAQQVPIWLLACTPDESAVRALENV